MPKKGGGERREDGRRGGKELELLVADVRRAATGREEGGDCFSVAARRNKGRKAIGED